MRRAGRSNTYGGQVVGQHLLKIVTHRDLTGLTAFLPELQAVLFRTQWLAAQGECACQNGTPHLRPGKMHRIGGRQLRGDRQNVIHYLWYDICSAEKDAQATPTAGGI